MHEQNISLSDICQIVDCEHKTAPTQENGIPLIRTPNIGRGFLILDNVQRISDETYQKWTRRAEPQPNDLIMAREAPVGNVAIIPKGNKVCLGQRTVLVRINSEKVLPAYLNYLLSSQTMHAYLNVLSNGATVGHLNVTDIRNLRIPELPSLPTQRKIAAILSAYDDLIENNRRRIAILETMAEEIYREWFVRFRFPGYQSAVFEKGIPKGWELRPFSDVVEINPTERPHKDEEKPYVGMEALSTNSMYFEWTEKRKGNSGSKFKNGDTLFPRITPCLENGKRGFTMTLEDGQIAVGSTEFIVMREKVLTPEFIYLLCCFEPFRTHAEISMVGASGRQRVAENCFSFFLVATPLADILAQFTQIVRPMFENVKTLCMENSVLSKTKNQLLPRLISGKLSVEHLDIQFPPGMEESYRD